MRFFWLSIGVYTKQGTESSQWPSGAKNLMLATVPAGTSDFDRPLVIDEQVRVALCHVEYLFDSDRLEWTAPLR